MPVRVRPYKSHVILYVVDEAGALVLHIRHGHEDWQTDPRLPDPQDQGDDTP